MTNDLRATAQRTAEWLEEQLRYGQWLNGDEYIRAAPTRLAADLRAALASPAPGAGVREAIAEKIGPMLRVNILRGARLTHAEVDDLIHDVALSAALAVEGVDVLHDAIRGLVAEIRGSADGMDGVSPAAALVRGTYRHIADRIDRMLDAAPLPPASARGGWKTMESYNPKSSPSICLVAYPNGHVTVAEYSEKCEGGPDDFKDWQAHIEPRISDDEQDFYVWPIAWQNLPAPPTQEG